MVQSPTELDRARTHLRRCQDHLAYVRKNGFATEMEESPVKAALSWVWDAQQRDEAWQVYELSTRLSAALRELIPEPQMLYIADTPGTRALMDLP
jgi:hypothetical protein